APVPGAVGGDPSFFFEKAGDPRQRGALEAQEVGELAHRLRSAQRQRGEDRELRGAEPMLAKPCLEMPRDLARCPAGGEATAIDAFEQVELHAFECRYTYRRVKRGTLARFSGSDVPARRAQPW